MVISVNTTPNHGKHLHLNTSGQIESLPFKQVVHLPNLVFQTPSISNGSDEATISNGGLGKGSLGNKVVENESPCIKPLIF